MPQCRGKGAESGARLENTRLLSVCALASNERELSYTKIATALEVEDTSVEEWVIKAVTADLIEAQIDQLRRVIVIDRATRGSLGPNTGRVLAQSSGIAYKCAAVARVIQTPKSSDRRCTSTDALLRPRSRQRVKLKCSQDFDRDLRIGPRSRGGAKEDSAR